MLCYLLLDSSSAILSFTFRWFSWFFIIVFETWAFSSKFCCMNLPGLSDEKIFLNCLLLSHWRFLSSMNVRQKGLYIKSSSRRLSGGISATFYLRIA